MRCTACGRECSARAGNDGFQHEFGFESFPVVFSSCCEADCLNDQGGRVTVYDVRREAEEEEADRRYDDHKWPPGSTSGF